MEHIKGIAASNGIAIAKAYQLTQPDLSYDKRSTDHPDEEIARLDKALDVSKQELEKIRKHTKEKIGEEQAEIFSAQLLVLDEQEMMNPIKEKQQHEKDLDIHKQELEKIRKHTKEKIGDEQAEIFSAHLLVLDDPELINPIKDKITNEQKVSYAALEETANHFIDIFENMDNA